MSLYGRAFLLWLGFGVLFFAGAAVRELLLAPWIGPLRAHQLETVVVTLVVFGLIRRFVRAARPTEAQALKLGALWLVLTVGFETTMVRGVQGRPWSVVFADYNLAAGRLWVLPLLVLLLSPFLIVRLSR